MKTLSVRALCATQIGVAIALAGPSADAQQVFSYEAVNTYSTCGITPNLNNCLTEARSFRDTMKTISGTSQRYGFEEQSVYDSDTVESDWVTNGQDDIWTDTATSAPGPGLTSMMFYSGHGSCNWPVDYSRYCNHDSDCTNGFKCSVSNNAHRCVGYADRQWITCSTYGDKFNHFVDLSTQVCFGENPYIPFSWKGCGQNGSLSYVAMDISCGSQSLYEIQGNGNMFGGFTVFMSFQGIQNSYPQRGNGDVGDSATRGAHWATRMKNGESVANAWIDATRFDEPGGTMVGPACVISMACDANSNLTSWDLNNATWQNQPNIIATGYNWCQWTYWCDF